MWGVQAQDVQGVGYLIFDTLAFRLARAPKLQVVDAVVRTIPVLVVDLFVRQKVTPQMGLHHAAMPQDLAAAPPGAHLKDDVSLVGDIPLPVATPFPNGGVSVSLQSLVVLAAQSVTKDGPQSARGPRIPIRLLT